MKKNKISVIVPFYNSERSISKCIYSILNQTYCNIEIIAVDDGSTDESIKIIEEIAEKDNRLKLLRQKNLGPSAARNAGVREVSGEYIAFVDSDDYIARDMYSNMIKKIADEQCDLVICAHCNVNAGKVSTNRHNPCSQKLIGPLQVFDELKTEEYNLLASVCNKIYKTRYIKENHIIFRKDFFMAEDLFFNMQYLANCTSVYFMNDGYYFYNKNSKSITNSIDERYLTSIFAYDEIIEFANKIKLSQFALDDLYREQYRFCYVVLKEFGELDDKMLKRIKDIENRLFRKIMSSKNISTGRKIKTLIRHIFR